MDFTDETFAQFQELTKIGFSQKNIRGLVYQTINKTAKDAMSPIAKEVVKYVSLRQKDVKEAMKLTKKAQRNSLSAVLTIIKKRRPSLKRFKAKGLKKGKKPAGITYTIKTKRTFAKGFIVDKLGGHAFMNIGGRKIGKLHGPSVWGVFKKHNLDASTIFNVGKRLEYNINRKVNHEISKYKLRSESAG